MYIAESHNTGDPTPYLPEETARIAELQHAGVIDWCLIKTDRSGAVVLVQASDAPSAHAALNTLPLVEHGITSFTLTEVAAL